MDYYSCFSSSKQFVDGIQQRKKLLQKQFQRELFIFFDSTGGRLSVLQEI